MIEDRFYMQISTMASTVIANWCWNSSQLRSDFWILMVKVVMLNKFDIFSCIDKSIILLMLGPKNCAFSFAVSSNLFMYGRILSRLSKLGLA